MDERCWEYWENFRDLALSILSLFPSYREMT